MLDYAELPAEKRVILEDFLKTYENSRRVGLPAPPCIKTKLGAIKDREFAQCIQEELDLASEHYNNQESSKFDTPRSFNGYTVAEWKATGGFGIVYQGFGPSGEIVAIKIAHFTATEGRPRHETEREAKVLQELAHKNIVEYIDSGWSDDGDYYIVTDWVEGQTLADMLHVAEYDLSTALATISVIANGIQFGHAQGIIHRDIKPRNIMITEDDECDFVKILDYGIAKQTSADETFSGHAKGSKDYMAPEQWEGNADERSDIYAMGRILREMLRKKYPDRKHLPKTVRKIIEKATAKKPADRFQSASDLQVAVDKIRVLLRTGSVREFSRPMVTPIIQAVLTAIALASAVAWTFWPSPPPTEPAFDPSNQLAAYFNEFGEARVIFDTNLQTAEIYAYPLRNGKLPDKSGEIYIGKGEGAVWLKPGYYFVVAIWPDGRFQEVLRAVPFDWEGRKHYWGVTKFRKEVRGLRLKTISMPSMSAKYTDTVLASSWLGACDELEDRGQRLPFAHELQADLDRLGLTQSKEMWVLKKFSDSTISAGLEVPLYAAMMYTVLPGGSPGFKNENNHNISYIPHRSSAPFPGSQLLD